MSRLLRGAMLMFLFFVFTTLPTVAQVSQSGSPNGGTDTQAPPAGNLVMPVTPLHHGVPWRDPNAPNAAAVGLAAPAGAHLTYFGGPVISNVQVVQVLYGSGSYNAQVAGTSTPSMGNFYSDFLGTSGYVSLMT